MGFSDVYSILFQSIVLLVLSEHVYWLLHLEDIDLLLFRRKLVELILSQIGLDGLEVTVH